MELDGRSVSIFKSPLLRSTALLNRRIELHDKVIYARPTIIGQGHYATAELFSE